jgi:hypothetical protein
MPLDIFMCSLKKSLLRSFVLFKATYYLAIESYEFLTYYLFDFTMERDPATFDNVDEPRGH